MNQRSADYRRQFIRLLTSHDGMAAYRRFELWAEAVYCAMAKATSLALGDFERATAIEAQFKRIETQVGLPVIQQFAEMTGCLTLALTESEGADFLSGLAGDEKVQALNQHIGQFFTPYEVCSMMAAMTVDAEHVQSKVDDVGYVTAAEPACGAGGMLLAIASRMRELGHSPEWRLWVDAADLSPLCFHMTYIQLSLVGVPGRVRHGNSLTQEFFDSALTFPSMFFIARHGLPGSKRQSPSETKALVMGQATLDFN